MVTRQRRYIYHTECKGIIIVSSTLHIIRQLHNTQGDITSYLQQYITLQDVDYVTITLLLIIERQNIEGDDKIIFSVQIMD